MTRSDWIALIAAIGTLLGLIPAYKSYFAENSSKKNKVRERKIPESPAAAECAKTTEIQMSHYARAAALTAIAFLFLVIELVAFSWLAHLFKVRIETTTMPLNWLVGFWCLFLIPALLCFLAFMNLVATMSD